MRFGPGGVSFGRLPPSYKIEKSFARTEEVNKRLQQVIGAEGHSWLLANSEHWARYVASGAWVSYWAVTPAVLQKFEECMAADKQLWKRTRSLVNAVPAQLGKPKMMKRELYPRRPHWVQYLKLLDYLMEEHMQECFNVVVLGPTGGGKSRLINMLCNLDVVESKGGSESVTKRMRIIHGIGGVAGGVQMKINILDTIGFCDTLLPEKELDAVLQHYIRTNMALIDKVVLVCEGRLLPLQKASMSRYLEWLGGYTKRNFGNVVLVYTKTDDLDEATKVSSLVNIWSELDLGSPWLMEYEMNSGGLLPSEWMRGAADAELHQVNTMKRACCAGFRPGKDYEDLEDDLHAIVNAIFLQPLHRIQVDRHSGCQIL